MLSHDCHFGTSVPFHALCFYIIVQMFYNFVISIACAVLLSETTASPLGSGIWQINIDNNPAPSPEDGAPQAVNAIRDPAYLPLQIGSIVGAYLVWIILISAAILTVGRRLRRSAHTNPRTLGMEILKPGAQLPTPKEFDPSPISPVKANPWDPSPVSPTKSKLPFSPRSWGSFKKHNRQGSMQSSVGTFDESVLSDDKMRNEVEMDRLYAAVAEHDAQKSIPKHQEPLASPLNQHPPEFQHLRYPAKHYNQPDIQQYSQPDVPQYPLSPPPDEEMAYSPTSPTRESTASVPSVSSRRLNKPPQLVLDNPPSRASSRSSVASLFRFGKKHNNSIRALPISPPIGSPETSPEYGEADPLTPRHYKPGPPPRPPVQRDEPLATGDDQRRYYFSPSIRSSRSSFTNGGFSPAQTPRTATFPSVQTPRTTTFPASQTPRTATFPLHPPPAIQEEQSRPGIAITIDTAVSSSNVPSLGSQAPSNNNATPRHESPRHESSREKGRRPTPLTLAGSTNSSQSTLALRTAPLPLRSLRSPNSTRPISTIKNTELLRPDPGRLRAPGTAGPQTPYSPFYMPQTPLTPMTPSRLVTREERKRQKKAEGRRVLTQEDMVVSEEDMWGEGY